MLTTLSLISVSKERLWLLQASAITISFIYIILVFFKNLLIREDPYIAMEYVRGSNLSEVIKKKSLTSFDNLKVAIQICAALKHAHGRGVIHRDIKPANIMLNDENHVTILDFGLARVLDASKLTRNEFIIGTPHYMSPEQTRTSEGIDFRTDIFSIGVVLYEIRTGKRPFDGDSNAAIFNAIQHMQPLPIKRYDNKATGSIQKILNNALAKDRDERYKNISIMLDDLKKEKGTVIRKSILTQADKKFKSYTLSMAFIILCLLLLASKGFWDESNNRGDGSPYHSGSKQTNFINGHEQPPKPKDPSPDAKEKKPRTADHTPIPGKDDDRNIPFGSMRVLSDPPGAIILLNSQLKGTTPLTLEKLKVGSYELTFKKQVSVIQRLPFK